jgi:hypothetical protein
MGSLCPLRGFGSIDLNQLGSGVVMQNLRILFFAQFFGEPEHPFEGQFGRPSLNPRTGERQ